jgi:hypothetical protein
LKIVPNPYNLYDPLRKQRLENRANNLLYGLNNTTQQQQENTLNSLDFHANKLPRKSCPLSLLYGLYGSVQYGLQQQQMISAPTQKFARGICAHFVLGNVPTKLLTFLSQALSENLSQSPSLVSCTLPNAFFYKSENDLLPPKFLFTFPTLNPKAKI